MENIRPPAVVGLFYPADPEILNDMIARDLSQTSSPSDTSNPKVLILPHAGYIYSGAITANDYRYTADSF